MMMMMMMMMMIGEIVKNKVHNGDVIVSTFLHKKSVM